jgi:RHS repeat-associated protein
LATVIRDGTLTASYEYDLNGNRTRLTTPSGVVTGSYDGQDRVISYGSTTFAYGSNGDLKSKTEPGVGTTSYSYDALGNLVAVTLPNGTILSYVIDGQNRRVGKRVDGVLTQGFLYQSPLAPVAELDGSNQVVSRFVYGTRGNVPDYMVKGGVIYRLLSDHLGSVRLVVKAADGTVAQRIDYDEFGQITQNTAPGFQPFGFAGGLLDDQTGLTRFGARDYDPTTGRWTAKDPVGYAGGQANFYAYVSNNPLNAIDPRGLGCFDTVIGFRDCFETATTWLERYGNAKDLWDVAKSYADAVAPWLHPKEALANAQRDHNPNDFDKLWDSLDGDGDFQADRQKQYTRDAQKLGRLAADINSHFVPGNFCPLPKTY